MALWFLLLLTPAQTIESKAFPRPLQQRAVAATVRIVNRSEKVEGSGVILGAGEKSIYILTAAHLLNRSPRLEISTFTADSYPRPAKVYDKVEVVARTHDMRDLGLIRVSTDDPLPERLPLCPPRLLTKKETFDALSAGCGAAGAPLCLVERVQGARLIRRQENMKPALFWEVKREQTSGRSGGPLLDSEGNLLGIASGLNDRIEHRKHVLLPELLELCKDALLHFCHVGHHWIYLLAAQSLSGIGTGEPSCLRRPGWYR